MNWVEKSSIEKIHRVLEIFKRERHYQVLLIPENIYAVRHNPAPYTLLVIPRPLPSDVVEGEHFLISDLWCLVSGSASSSRDPVIEASSWVQGAGSVSGSSTSSRGGSSSSPSTPSRRARSSHPERLLLLAQVARLAPRVVKVKRKGASGSRNAPESKREDFVPWVPADTEGLPDLEEEEREERMTGLLDRYAAHKRKRQVSSSGETDTAPVETASPGGGGGSPDQNQTRMIRLRVHFK